MKCGVCAEQPFKYKCPTCTIRYCSVACYRQHKDELCSDLNEKKRKLDSVGPSVEKEQIDREETGKSVVDSEKEENEKRNKSTENVEVTAEEAEVLQSARVLEELQDRELREQIRLVVESPANLRFELTREPLRSFADLLNSQLPN